MMPIEIFHEEPLTMFKLKHARVVRVLGVNYHPQQPFFILELMPGGCLRTALRNFAFPPSMLLDFGSQVGCILVVFCLVNNE